jgi:hypothetical protein
MRVSDLSDENVAPTDSELLKLNRTSANREFAMDTGKLWGARRCHRAGSEIREPTSMAKTQSSGCL